MHFVPSHTIRRTLRILSISSCVEFVRNAARFIFVANTSNAVMFSGTGKPPWPIHYDFSCSTIIITALSSAMMNSYGCVAPAKKNLNN